MSPGGGEGGGGGGGLGALILAEPASAHAFHVFHSGCSQMNEHRRITFRTEETDRGWSDLNVTPQN